MASHLTITSTAPTGVTSSKSFSGAASMTESGDGPLGIFGALLAGAAATTEQTGTAAGNGMSFDLGALIKLTLGAGGEGSDGQATDPEALAAPADGTGATTDAVVLPQPLVNFIDALTDLKTALESGKPVDPDLLGKVEQALSGLAEALGLDIDKLKAPKDISSLLAGMDGDRPDLAAMLAALLTPIAQSMDNVAASTTDTAAFAATTDRLAAIGDKMAALLAALEKGDVAAEKLATLGVSTSQPLDPEIEAALKRFAEAAKTAATPVPTEPALATPALKLSEPVLTGKAAETPVPSMSTSTSTAPTAATPAKTDTTDTASASSTPVTTAPEALGKEGSTSKESGTGTGNEPPRTAESVRNDRQPDGPVAFAPADAPAAQSSGQAAPQNQPQAVRLDAAANPRFVQVGYQTSQQQLNLPQLAFELARQVTDGNTRFQIRLDPPELGRIDVRLDIDKAGQVNARLMVEKAETLDLMQRDQRGLEKALQQAGVDTSKTNLEFSLKQNPFAGQQNQSWQGHGHGEPNGQTAAGTGGEEAEPAPPQVTLYRGALQASGVNIIA